MSADDTVEPPPDLSPATLDAIRRRRKGVRAALDELERAVAAPATGRAEEWRRAVIDRLELLREAFTHHVVVTEGRDGLFEEIMTQAPRLAHQVDKLRGEHQAIGDALTRVLADRDAEDIEALREAVLQVMGAVVRHRHAGSGLVYEAYFVDIDAAD